MAAVSSADLTAADNAKQTAEGKAAAEAAGLVYTPFVDPWAWPRPANVVGFEPTQTSKEWRHRDDDEPWEVWNTGERTWCKNGKVHRDGDKPAHIYPVGGNGGWVKVWYINGVQQRITGPEKFIRSGPPTER